MAALRAVARAAAVAVPAAQLARLGFPALIGAFGLAVLILAVACWVLASDARCERAAKVLGACHAAPAAVAPAPVPARTRWWRRRAG